MSEGHPIKARLPLAGQVWPAPFNAAETAEHEALLPAGADRLNEVLLARVAKAATGQSDPVVAAYRFWVADPREA